MLLAALRTGQEDQDRRPMLSPGSRELACWLERWGRCGETLRGEGPRPGSTSRIWGDREAKALHVWEAPWARMAQGGQERAPGLLAECPAPIWSAGCSWWRWAMCLTSQNPCFLHTGLGVWSLPYRTAADGTALVLRVYHLPGSMPSTLWDGFSVSVIVVTYTQHKIYPMIPLKCTVS